MSLVMPSGSAQEDAWARGEAEAIALMGTINAATASLVSTIGMLIDTEGWVGHGIASVEHWVCWKADVSRHRALGLVAIAWRRRDLPVCWGLFEQGRLTEDAMVRIARRVPTERDGEVAGWASSMLISQLTRVLASLPELQAPVSAEPQRQVLVGTGSDGWLRGDFCLPPDEGAVVMAGLMAGRDAEFRDRNDLDLDAPVPDGGARAVGWADALVRMASEACDGLDPTLARTGHRGERHQVVIHRHLDPDGNLGPARLHLGGHLPDPVARYLGCDARIVIADHLQGRLVGITPTVRTANRKLRRYLEQRDGGCAHPLCDQKRWLHAHHLTHWENGGLTTPDNLLCLCPRHHRALHQGDFTIDGDPEAGTIVFTDRHHQRIEPPHFAPPGAAPTRTGSYQQPTGERLEPRWFNWN